MTINDNFPALVQAFFTDRLLRQRRASPHTVAGYRDTFRLLLRFAARRLGKEPSNYRSKIWTLRLSVSSWITSKKSAQQRAGPGTPAWRPSTPSSATSLSMSQLRVDLCRRVLAIPSKRYERRPIEYLTPKKSTRSWPRR